MAEINWVVPAISAGASLVGTMVGGFSTYWTSKRSFERSLASQQSDQRNTLLREAAVRFIATVTETRLLQNGLARIAEQWAPETARLASAATSEEFAAAARSIVPGFEPGADRAAALIKLMRSTGAFDDDVRRAATLLTELRLIAPRDVAESAQRVLYSGAARELATAWAPPIQRQATDAFNQEINDFFNHVRHHMNVENIEFDLFNEEVGRRALGLR